MPFGSWRVVDAACGLATTRARRLATIPSACGLATACLTAHRCASLGHTTQAPPMCRPVRSVVTLNFHYAQPHRRHPCAGLCEVS